MHEQINLSSSSEVIKHLNPGVNPIIACVGTYKDFIEQDVEDKEINTLDAVYKDFYDRSGDTAQNVDTATTFNLPESGFLHGREISRYAISPIDNQDKFSEGFIRCTGLVVVGKGRENREEISFLTHQDPSDFLFDERTNFIAHLEQRLNEMKDRCVPGTIDAVIVGGTDFESPGSPYDTFWRKENYAGSIKLLGTEIQKILGFEPLVVNGSKDNFGQEDSIFFYTKKRQLYFIRRKVNTDTTDFLPSKFNKT